MLAAIATPYEELMSRAERFRSAFPAIEIVGGDSVIGGGSAPDVRLCSPLISLKGVDVIRAEQALRARRPAVIARIDSGSLLFDLRTVNSDDEDDLMSALRAVL